ncbi:MAG TPA: acetylornithine transaminase [Candidatus Dormibacteraeota bacterium]|nr:acetylornithine transaminase [Candidatus Dormibacteraeota bacterium]
MSNTEKLRQRFGAVLMRNYAELAPDVALACGRGCRVTDADGREYLDLAAGIAVSSLGHAHPDLVAAIAGQAAEIIHASHQFLHEREVELAERLREVVSRDGHPGTAGARAFFCNSGTEATEAALKVVWRRQGPGRRVMVAAENGFHGRSMGALALAGVPSVREAFAPFGFDVRFVPYGDAEAVAAAVREDTAAVVLEPIQGEAGVICPPPGYLKAVRDVCDAGGALLVLDEVQSGIGRTGRWFAYQHEGVVPDVLTLAKGLGGGLPIGACIGIGDCATALTEGDHGSTFGGNPLACAAALTVLRVIERDHLLENAAAVGSALAEGLAAIDHPLIAEVRGRGLWRAVALTAPVAAEVVAAARRAGFLVGPDRADSFRMAPPLILTAAEAAEFTSALPGILAEVADGMS